MRNSILTEFVVAIIILGAVAWLWNACSVSDQLRGQPKLMREIFTFISAS